MAIGVYPLLHGACCSQTLDSVMVNPRMLFGICAIRIILGVARRMALEKTEWNLFVVNGKKVVNAMSASGVFLTQT